MSRKSIIVTITSP